MVSSLAGIVQSGGQWEKVCPGHISETVSCWKLITWLGHWLADVGVQCHGVTFI